MLFQTVRLLQAAIEHPIRSRTDGSRDGLKAGRVERFPRERWLGRAGKVKVSQGGRNAAERSNLSSSGTSVAIGPSATLVAQRPASAGTHVVSLHPHPRWAQTLDRLWDRVRSAAAEADRKHERR